MLLAPLLSLVLIGLYPTKLGYTMKLSIDAVYLNINLMCLTIQVMDRTVIPTPLRIGFLGLGIMGQGMVMNLLRSGHEVTVWNRTATKVGSCLSSPQNIFHQLSFLFVSAEHVHPPHGDLAL